MKFQIVIVSVLFSLFFSGCNSQIKIGGEDNLRLGGWNYTWMTEVKESLGRGEEKFQPAFERIIDEGEKAIENGVYSVTFKNMVPPSGSKHDYMSMGPYWWPDPDQPDGLPYIRRDGEVNPERNNLDSPRKSQMINSVRTLSLAWYFSDKIKYAEKAAVLLDAWFLDPETKMNPHLEYAQSIPGRTPGRFIGLIDVVSFHELVDAIALLETSGSLSEMEISKIHTWFDSYFRWLVESGHGEKEDNYKNNHSVAYDVQSSGIAIFNGDYQFAKWKVRELPRRRIDPMIESDGSQPHELIRTKAFSYSVSNLDNFFNVGEKGIQLDVNVFNYVNVKGGSIQKALDYLIRYIDKEGEWPYEQISDWSKTEDRLGLLIRRAAAIYENKEYQALWEDRFHDKLKSHWSLLVKPEL